MPHAQTSTEVTSQGSRLTRFLSPANITSPPSEEFRRRQFDMMESSFGCHGGLYGGDELALLTRGRGEQPMSLIARAIVNRSLVNVVWQGKLLIPAFQFALHGCSVRDDVAVVVDELVKPFDDWELALWFALPNLWLKDMAPVDMLARDPAAVLGAARADRFIALG
ncbi:MAG: hypothetical protein ABI460_02885 [Caldimonas sp.]